MRYAIQRILELMDRMQSPFEEEAISDSEIQKMFLLALKAGHFDPILSFTIHTKNKWLLGCQTHKKQILQKRKVCLLSPGLFFS